MQGRSQEVPSVMENPLTMVDAERDSVMKDFKKVLSREAGDVRHLIERHVKL